MHSLYMTGPPAGAQRSLALGQSGLADAASASCPGGDHSFHACSHRHTLEQHKTHSEQMRCSNDSFHSIANYRKLTNINPYLLIPQSWGWEGSPVEPGCWAAVLGFGESWTSSEKIHINLQTHLNVSNVAVKSLPLMFKYLSLTVFSRVSPCFQAWGLSSCGAGVRAVCSQVLFRFGQQLLLLQLWAERWSHSWADDLLPPSWQAKGAEGWVICTGTAWSACWAWRETPGESAGSLEG